MTKDEFVTKVAEKTGLTKKDAAAAVNAYNEALKEVSSRICSQPWFRHTRIFPCFPGDMY